MITFSGLASGLDTSSIIDQLVSLERAPATAMAQRRSATNQQISIVGDLVSKLKTLATKMEGFEDRTSVRAMAATSSDESRVAVVSAGDAQPGTYKMRVTSLAQAETSASRAFGTSGPGTLAAGSVGITVGADAPVTISWAATDSLADIASRINDSDARVSASVLFDGTSYRLMMTSQDTGTANALSFTNGGDPLVMAEVVPPDDAVVVMNNIPITRSSNTFSDVVAGVTIELAAEHAAGEPDAVINVVPDHEATRDKLQEFVDGYNTLHDALSAQLSYTGTKKGDNTLFGDTTLRGLQGKLAAIITSEYAHGPLGSTSLGRLGLQLDNTGKMTINASKFDAAVSADPSALEHLFAGNPATAGEGLSKIFQDMVDAYTRSGDGILTAKSTALSGRIKVFDQQIERIETRASALEERLVQQFSALEQAMTALQGQMAYLSNI